MIPGRCRWIWVRSGQLCRASHHSTTPQQGIPRGGNKSATSGPASYVPVSRGSEILQSVAEVFAWGRISPTSVRPRQDLGLGVQSTRPGVPAGPGWAGLPHLACGLGDPFGLVGVNPAGLRAAAGPFRLIGVGRHPVSCAPLRASPASESKRAYSEAAPLSGPSAASGRGDRERAVASKRPSIRILHNGVVRVHGA